jgi:glycosyltransferase involved in cell wall biosynthesis
MRILYDHQAFSLQDAGGVSRYFYEIARYMSSVSDVRTDLWMGSNACVYPFRELASSCTRVSSLPGVLPKGSIRYIGNEILGNLQGMTSGRFDLYHPTTYLKMPLVRSRRVVLTHHDCTHERFPELFPDVKKVLWARRWTLPRVDAIICVSEYSRRDLLHYYDVDPAKTRVIHHGLTPLRRSEKAAAALGKRLKRDYILYVGMRAAFKNFHGLLQALHDSKLAESFDLLVLGGGELTSKEKTLIQSLGLSNSVISMNKVSDEMLAEAYAGARLFVYPSLSEGFGIPPLEAMSLGCPVLASSAASIPEICGDAPFYFDPRNSNSFTSGLLRAVQDESAREQAVRAGGRVIARYRWDRCGEQTLALYRECQS